MSFNFKTTVPKECFLNNYQRVVSTLFTTSSFCFAFFWLPYNKIFDFFCSVLILAFFLLLLLPSNIRLRKDPFFRMGVIFFIYLFTVIAWHKISLPEGTPRITSTRKYIRFFYFLPIAYAISYSRFLDPWKFLVSAFSGLIAYLVINFDLAEWTRAWNGYRTDFGIENAQHTGVIFATCAIAFTIFTARFIQWSKKLPLTIFLGSLIIWFSALLFCVWVVFISQTRAVWLGLSISTLIILLFSSLIYILRKRSTINWSKFSTGLLGVLLASALIGYNFNIQEIVKKRLDSENVSLESLRLAASHEKKQMTSFEIRVASWSAAPEWIMEKPFLGWGRRGAKNLIQESDYFNEGFKSRFGHLHNSYLEALVDLGFIGSGFIITIIFLFGHYINRNYKKGKIPTDAFIFSWAFFIFWLIVNVFESYIIFSSGTYLVSIVAAFSYSFIIKENLNKQTIIQDKNTV